MLKIALIPPLPKLRQLALLQEQGADDNRLFQNVPLTDFAWLTQALTDSEEADILLLPHLLTDVRSYPDYVENAIEVAQKNSQRLVIFISQDDPSPLHFPEHCTIFRPSVYKSTLLPNEIVMPAQIEDIGEIFGHEPMEKGAVPTVGFVGMAATKNMKDRIRFLVKNYIVRRGADREGVYFRSKALKRLQADDRISLSTILRSRFSANRKSIELPPEQAREEYIKNMKANLFTLAPRGAGNYSLRFYETLALGRIPILVDTDTKLPFEDEIPYDEFIIRVPWKDMHRIADIVAERFDLLTEQSALAMQLKAREVFETHLNLPIFLKKSFEQLTKKQFV